MDQQSEMNTDIEMWRVRRVVAAAVRGAAMTKAAELSHPDPILGYIDYNAESITRDVAKALRDAGLLAGSRSGADAGSVA